MHGWEDPGNPVPSARYDAVIQPKLLSVVIPLYNEEENVRPLVDAVRSALEQEGPWELILVDDGSTDDTRAALRAAAAHDRRIRVLLLPRNVGQTAALRAGLEEVRGQVVVTMDGDLQNDPEDIPHLVAVLDEGFDLVAGYRKGRKDPLLTRRVPSWLANRLVGWITGVPIRDNGCSLKAYRRELVDRLHLYADLHRFIPALAVSTAGARIVEVPVRHHPRRAGRSKYGLSRTWKVLSDLLVLSMIRSFRDRPLIPFASAALVTFALAGAFGFRSVVTAVEMEQISIVLPTVTALLAGLGAYFVMLGLLSEAAVFHARERTPPSSYLIQSSPREKRLCELAATREGTG